MEQHRPYCIQIEPVFGCNLRCKMCGINSVGLKLGEYKFMNIRTARIIVDSIKKNWPKIRIEFAMCGEPTLSPIIEEIIQLFRGTLPDAHLLFTTNGVNFLNDKWFEDNWNRKLLPCNIVVVDLYAPYGEKLKDQLRHQRFPFDWAVRDYYSDNFNQHHYHHPKEGNFLVLIDDFSTRTNRKHPQRTMFNHAGNSALTPPLKTPLFNICTFPFREMVIRYNGVVNICCLDFGSELDMGNVLEQDLKDIWFGENFNVVRRFLRHKSRVFPPCSVCDMPGGFRRGILPDYEKPGGEDMLEILGIYTDSQRYNNKEFKFSFPEEGELRLLP